MSNKGITIYDSTGHHAPTSESRQQVMEMVACGMEPEDIAYALAIAPYEVELHYKEELARGTRLISAVVASGVLKNAKDGDSSSQQFWLKHRAGWMPPTKVELTGKNGNPIEVEERKKIMDDVIGLAIKAGVAKAAEQVKS